MRGDARAVAALLLGVTFVVGSLTGMVIEEALGLDWFDFLDTDEDFLDMDDENGEERLLEGLGFTNDQEDRVEEILEQQEDRLEAYWESRLPEIRAIVDSSRLEIRAVLTPQQRAVFDRRLERLRTRVPEWERD